MKPTDTVPGTKATWGDALKNFVERVDETDRAKQKKADGIQSKVDLEEVLGKKTPELLELLKRIETPSKLPEKPVPAPVPLKQVATPCALSARPRRQNPCHR